MGAGYVTERLMVLHSSDDPSSLNHAAQIDRSPFLRKYAISHAYILASTQARVERDWLGRLPWDEYMRLVRDVCAPAFPSIVSAARPRILAVHNGTAMSNLPGVIC